MSIVIRIVIQSTGILFYKNAISNNEKRDATITVFARKFEPIEYNLDNRGTAIPENI